MLVSLGHCDRTRGQWEAEVPAVDEGGGGGGGGARRRHFSVALGQTRCCQ